MIVTWFGREDYLVQWSFCSLSGSGLPLSGNIAAPNENSFGVCTGRFVFSENPGPDQIQANYNGFDLGTYSRVSGNTYDRDGGPLASQANSGAFVSGVHTLSFDVVIPPEVEVSTDGLPDGVEVDGEGSYPVGSNVEVSFSGGLGRYDVKVNGVAVASGVLMPGSFTIENIQEDSVVTIEEVVEPGEDASWSRKAVLHLWDVVNGGPSDTGVFSLPETFSAGSNVLIPPSGSVGVTASKPLAGVWQVCGVASQDGFALPAGNICVDVLQGGVNWVQVAMWAVDGTKKSTGTSPCLILKNENPLAPAPREFRMQYFFNQDSTVTPPTTPPDGTGWIPPAPTGGDDGVEPVPPKPTGPDPVEPPTPGTPPVPPAPVGGGSCVCSPWYEAIALSLNSLNANLSAQLEALNSNLVAEGEGIIDGIEWVGDVVDQRLGEVVESIDQVSEKMDRIADILEEIRDKPVNHVEVETGSCHTAHYPGVFEDGEQYLDGGY